MTDLRQLREDCFTYMAQHAPSRPGTYADCVERGARMLDAVWPGWANGLEAENLVGRRHLIDLETLDLHSPSSCVLGQLFADNDWGHPGFLYVSRPVATGEDYRVLYDYGFDIPGNWDFDTSPYRLLTSLWRDAIVSRRMAVTA